MRDRSSGDRKREDQEREDHGGGSKEEDKEEGKEEDKDKEEKTKRERGEEKGESERKSDVEDDNSTGGRSESDAPAITPRPRADSHETPPQRRSNAPRFFKAVFSSAKSRLWYAGSRLLWSCLLSAIAHKQVLGFGVLSSSITNKCWRLTCLLLAGRALHLVLSFPILPAAWIYSPDGYNYMLPKPLRHFSLQNRHRCRCALHLCFPSVSGVSVVLVLPLQSILGISRFRTGTGAGVRFIFVSSPILALGSLW